MESAGEKAEVPVQSTTAPSEAEKPAENKDSEPQATTEDPSAGVKVRNTSTSLGYLLYSLSFRYQKVIDVCI